MIRLDRFELLHWDIQPHQMLPLARGVTLLTGENGAGKTSILDAIKICLGAVRLDGERSVDKYLLKQARPVAMLRLLIDNRPGDARRRPFDPLGEHGADIVTLAVVFRAEDEKSYRRDYYILDGDRSPLVVAPPGRPLRVLSGAEYRARLHKVGLSERYLKLLRLQQGQIASLCQYDGTKLFEYLFDVIGGQEAKANWELRLRELREGERAHEEARKEMEGAEQLLALLGERVRRHAEYLRLQGEIAALGQAIPHARLREQRLRSERLGRRIQELERSISEVYDKGEAAQKDMLTARQERHAIEARQADVERRSAELQRELITLVEAQTRAEARFEQLEALRIAAESIPQRACDEIERELEGHRRRLAQGQAAQAERTEVRQRVEADLRQIDKGLLPLPPEVTAFRERLRRAGIPHHLLADVLELGDDSFREALEGYLGRLRFAVLVQEPDAWAQAALLAREARYPHGVLAPDVRGTSPSDTEGLLPALRVREARYRSLVARLLRPVIPGEPPQPLSPPRHGEHLAQDGFLVTRLEARHAPAGPLYLGRDALARRRQSLAAELVSLDEQAAAWQTEEAGLRTELRSLSAQLDAQRQRLAWEAAAPEHQELATQREVQGETRLRLDSDLAALKRELRQCHKDAVEQGAASLSAEKESARCNADRAQLRKDQEQVEQDKVEVDEELGRLAATPLPELGPRAEALLKEFDSAKTLAEMRRQHEAGLAQFEPDVRDPLLPENHRRQQAEVDAVNGRLQRLAGELGRTRAAAEEAQEQYQQVTKRIFRAYFARLREAGRQLDFQIDGKLVPAEGLQFACDVRIGVGEKASVHYRSEDLSGGQRAALSILMGMGAVSLDAESAGFFLIDEPFSASDVNKINELGEFLQRTRAQYLVSMPTSADVEQCGDWLAATWICTRTRGGYDERGRPLLAPPVKVALAHGSRDG